MSHSIGSARSFGSRLEHRRQRCPPTASPTSAQYRRAKRQCSGRNTAFRGQHSHEKRWSKLTSWSTRIGLLSMSPGDSRRCVRNERGLHIQWDSSHWRLPVMGRESGNPAGEIEAPAELSGAAVSNADRQSRSTSAWAASEACAPQPDLALDRGDGPLWALSSAMPAGP